MADIRKKVPENVAGEFFVDTTCIDCSACRQLAPDTYGATGEYSYIQSQPDTPERIRTATQALLACPVGSIGTAHPNDAKRVMQDFPLRLEDSVYYCGFNSPKSYGGNSYFVQHPDGNWLIDSPKYLPFLAERFQEMGGIRYIFLTHEDDVADAADYAKAFGSTRIIHRAAAEAQPDAEWILDGREVMDAHPDFRIIPTPGHTKGHCVLLFQNRFLFTGDHLSWHPQAGELYAFRNYCWYSWSEQTDSMARLAQETFDWVLPGHGYRQHLTPETMHRELVALEARMRG